MADYPAEGITRFLQVYEPGKTIFSAGEKGGHMYVVHEGDVDIFAGDQSPPARLATLGKGKFFGEMALVDKAPRTATAIAGATGAKVLAIDRTHFVYLVSQQPAFALVVMEELVARVRGRPPENAEREAHA